MIARAPDFFGPIKKNSVLMNLIYDNLAKGRKAQWFCNADVAHTTGFAPDLAKGTAVLGNTPDAINRIWNLPVDGHAPTGREWVRLFSNEMKASGEVRVLPAWGVKALGMFVPVLREFYEMRYQYDREYYFDSGKFTAAFGFTPTTNEEAVRQTVESLKH
jgi:nucleoside-diphosphate-sugar epimerase